MREIMNVSSLYDAKSRTTTVQVDVGDRNCAGVLVWSNSYIGKAKWNKADTFDPIEGIRIAYCRAIKQIPKENIIEKCGGLRNGDWVCMQNRNNDLVMWGIVFNNNILYMMGSGAYDRVSDFSDGETEFNRITTVVRPTADSHPVTYNVIRLKSYFQAYANNHCEVYTAD